MKIRKSSRTSFQVKRERMSDALAAVVEKSEHRQYLALGLDAVTRMVSAESRSMEFIASTDSVDRYGDVIEQDGWNLGNFQKNPVFLWGHDSSAPPIGKVSNISVLSNRLIATVQFATADVYPLADTIFKMYQKGFLNAVSVGFLPIDYEIDMPDEDSASPVGVRFTQVELLEISAVTVPANPEALVVDDASHVLEKLIASISGKPSKRNALEDILAALED
jgi:HK97 family phage prohead protease